MIPAVVATGISVTQSLCSKGSLTLADETRKITAAKATAILNIIVDLLLRINIINPSDLPIYNISMAQPKRHVYIGCIVGVRKHRTILSKLYQTLFIFSIELIQ